MGEKLKVGDVVFFSTSNNTVAGEAMFIGRLKASPEDLVLVGGKQMFRDVGEVLHADSARFSGRRPELAAPISQAASGIAGARSDQVIVSIETGTPKKSAISESKQFFLSRSHVERYTSPTVDQRYTSIEAESG